MRPYYERCGITIYHGDWREVLPQLPTVDHVITDPPYSIRTHRDHIGRSARAVINGRSALGFAGLTTDDFVTLCDDMVAMTRRWVVMTCDYRLAPAVFDRDYFIRLGVWIKIDGAPQFTGDRPGMGYEPILILHRTGRKRWNGGGRPAVWFATVIRGDHPTQKPDALAAMLIADFTDPRDLILDPCMGSGTTVVAAKRLGRLAIGIDIDEGHCDIAATRLAQDILPLEPAPEVVVPQGLLPLE
jgi:site-specific DNA-methyltransferase (adenine-specific)